LKICLVTSGERTEASACPEPYPSGTALALFLQKRGHDPTLLFTGSGQRARLHSWRKRGLPVVSLFQERAIGSETFYPALLEKSWLTYRWLKVRDFDLILFQDDSSAGLISFQARTLREAFASTHLGYYLHGPTQWSAHLREARQLVHLDPVLDYSVQYGVEYGDRLIIPAPYYLDRIEKSGWRQPKKVSILPYLSEMEPVAGAGDFPGTLRHLVYPVHPTDNSSFFTFLQALSSLPGDLADVRVTFLSHGSRRDKRMFYKRARRYLRAYFPDLNWKVLPAGVPLPKGEAGALSIFSPLWVNLPCLLLEAVGRGELVLCAKTKETESIPELASNLVEWNAGSLTSRLRECLAGRDLPQAHAADRAKAEKAWDDYLLSVDSERRCPAPERSMDDIRVSICVAHFNKGAYLTEALESLRAQTHANVEVLVVDDASDDPESLRVFQSEASRHATPEWVFVRQSENRGPGYARNLAAGRATGSYLLFFDADDIAFPDMVERMLRAVLQPNVDCVAGSSRRFRQTRGRREMIETSTYAGGSLECAFLLPPAGTVFIVGTEIFADVGGFRNDAPGECHEDWNFHVRLLARGRNLHVLPGPVFAYRSSEHSRVSFVTKDMINNLDPFLQSTPAVQKKLLTFALNRAGVADHALKALRDLDPMSPGIRFLRFMGRTKRSFQRRRDRPGKWSGVWARLGRWRLPDFAAANTMASGVAFLESVAFFPLRLSNYLFKSRLIRSVLDHLKVRRAFRSRWTDSSLATALQLVEITDRVFRAADLPYMAYAGTLLGVERHGGVIPWDDDIDLCIEGRDLPKLLDLTERFARCGVRLLEAGLCYKLCWADRRNINRKVPWSWPFIDIFVWDKIGSRLVIRHSRDHYPLKSVFPLRSAPFHHLSLPVPQDSKAFLSAWFGADFMKTAVSSTCFHRKERIIRRTPFTTTYPLPTWRPFLSRRRLPRRQLCELLLRAGTDYLKACGVEFWADYGTLLGAYRNGSLLPHELDIDLSMMEESVPALLRNLHLLDPDFEFYDTSYRHRGPKYGIMHRKYGGNCDFYTYRRTDDCKLRICLGDEWRGSLEGRDVPEEMIFPLEPARIDGISLMRPRQTREYLIHRYDYIDYPAVLKSDGSGHYRSIWAQEPLENSR